MLNKTELYIQRIVNHEHIKLLADRRFHTFEGMVHWVIASKTSVNFHNNLLLSQKKRYMSRKKGVHTIHTFIVHTFIPYSHLRNTLHEA